MSTENDFSCLPDCHELSSVAQPCLTLCNPMDCSTPGLPVHHQLPEFTQIHVHWIGDAIQPSHLLLSHSPLAFNLAHHQGLFQVSRSVFSIQGPKYWRFSFSISPSNDASKTISFRMDWLDLLAVQGTSQESSPTPQFKIISSSALSFLYRSTLIHTRPLEKPQPWLNGPLLAK